MLLVQKFLETNSFQDLQDQHGVYVSFSKSGHKFSLNYDQLESKESDLLAQECRGLILSFEDGRSIINEPNYKSICPGKTKILAFPMKRFFNYGQGAAANINWSDPNLCILEKLDGTLCIVYWDPFINKWCVATRSVPEADLMMNETYTFRTLFEKAVQDTMKMSFDSFTNILVKDLTYCFELTTPYNRIVVKYDRCGITFLAARDLITLQEMNPADFSIVCCAGVPCAQTYSYSSLSELVDLISSLNPMDHEGVVVRDSNFNRIKIKNAAYVAASKIRDQLSSSPRNCLEIILLGKDDDAATYLPIEMQENLLVLKNKFLSWLKEQEHLAQVIVNEAASLSSDKKTFALTVQKYNPDFSAALFSIYDKKADSIKSFIVNNRKNGSWSDSFLDKLLGFIK